MFLLGISQVTLYHLETYHKLYQFILCDYRSHVTVDEQTLIAQIGGILGITHGWSGKTFFVELFDTMLTVVSFYIPLL